MSTPSAAPPPTGQTWIAWFTAHRAEVIAALAALLAVVSMTLTLAKTTPTASSQSSPSSLPSSPPPSSAAPSSSPPVPVSSSANPAPSSSTPVVSSPPASPSPSNVTVSPTPSSSAVSATHCLKTPSACGWPDATNTGAHGTLTASGSITSTTDGQVIRNLNVTGFIKVTSANVIIENVKVTGGDALGGIDLHQATGHTTISDVTVIVTPSQTAAMTIHDATVIRADLSGGQDGIDAWGGGGANPFNVVQDSYIHGLQRSSTSHDDTLQTSGGDETFVHNTLIPFTAGDPMNSCLQIGALQGDLAQLTFTGNLCDGGNYSINANNSGIPATHKAGPLTFTNNRFGTDYRYGIKTHIGSPFVTTWTGNTLDTDGSVIP